MLLTPAYRLVMGDREVDTTQEPRASTVERLEVHLDLDAGADALSLRLGNADGLEPEEGDDVTVELGYADEAALTLVLTGTVASVEPGLTVTHVAALSPAATLLAARADTTFLDMTAGDIVRQLADDAGVAVATADDGTRFPAYVIDGRRAVYAHMRDLADLSGCVVFVDEEGELVFRTAATPTQTHVFEFARHLVELEIRRSTAAAASVDVRGESAGASQGEDSWAWLTKDSDAFKGTAGSGAPTLLLERPVLRTAEATQAAADAAFAFLSSTATRGRLRTFGRPQIRLGDTLRIKDVPDDRLNGDFRVRAVRHSIDKRSGFRTEVEFVGMP